MNIDMKEINRLVFYVYISALIMFSLLCLMVGLNLVSSELFPNENMFLLRALMIDSYGLLFASLFLLFQKSWAYYLYKCFALLLALFFTFLFYVGGYKVMSLMIYVSFLIMSIHILNRSEIKVRFQNL